MGEGPFRIKPGETIEIQSLIYREAQTGCPSDDTLTDFQLPDPDETRFIRISAEDQEKTEKLICPELIQPRGVFKNRN